MHLIVIMVHILLMTELVFPLEMYDKFMNSNKFFNTLLTLGSTAVDQFFTIAAFLFVKDFLEDETQISIKKSMLKRWLRMIPILILPILTSFFFRVIHLDKKHIFSILFHLDNFSWFFTPESTFGHLWSVAIDFQVLLIICVILKYSSKNKQKLYFFFSLLLLLSILSTCYVFSFHIPYSLEASPFLSSSEGEYLNSLFERLPSPNFIYYTEFDPTPGVKYQYYFYTNTITRSAPFALGAMVAVFLHFRNKKKHSNSKTKKITKKVEESQKFLFRKLFSPLLIVAFFLLWVRSLWLVFGYEIEHILMNLGHLFSSLLCCSILIATCSNQTDWLHLPFLSKFLSFSFFTFFADSTFCSYVIHVPIGFIMLDYLKQHWFYQIESVARFLFEFSIILIVISDIFSKILVVFYENPFKKYLYSTFLKC